MLMLYMLVLSPVVSAILTVPLKRRIHVSIEVPSPVEVEKDGIVKVSVHIRNQSILPVPFVDITFIQAVNFELSGLPNCKISIGSLQTKTVTMEYRARRRGLAKVGVNSVVLRDYLGFFRFSLLEGMEEYQHVGELMVLPRLFNIKSNSKIMMGSGQAHIPDDNGEASTGVLSWTGEPGYEFREYMPGDPLHKVHWKLSAKKEALMVRKDEGRGIPGKRLILDSCITVPEIKQPGRENYLWKVRSKTKQNDSNEEVLIREEKILEALLAVAYLGVKTSRDMEVWLLENGCWMRHLVTDRKDLNKLQHRLAAYQFVDAESFDSIDRMPLTHMLENRGKGRNFSGGEVIIFTGSMNELLMNSMDGFIHYRMTVDMVFIKDSGGSNESGAQTGEVIPVLGQGNLWTLSADEDLVEAFS